MGANWCAQGIRNYAATSWFSEPKCIVVYGKFGIELIANVINPIVWTVAEFLAKVGVEGSIRRRIGHNLLLRLRNHKGDALRFLLNKHMPFTNDQAEHDLRMIKLGQKISGGFRAATGAQTFAALRTALPTALKKGCNIFETIAKNLTILPRPLPFA
jgi:hypothetical protein